MNVSALALAAAVVAIGLAVVSAKREPEPEAGMVAAVIDLLALTGSMSLGVLALVSLANEARGPGTLTAAALVAGAVWFLLVARPWAQRLARILGLVREGWTLSPAALRLGGFVLYCGLFVTAAIWKPELSPFVFLLMLVPVLLTNIIGERYLLRAAKRELARLESDDPAVFGIETNILGLRFALMMNVSTLFLAPSLALSSDGSSLDLIMFLIVMLGFFNAMLFLPRAIREQRRAQPLRRSEQSVAA